MNAKALVAALEAVPPRMRKPEYFFHPSQVFRRLSRGRKRVNGSKEVVLPWGSPLRIRPDDAIGQAIWRTGTYDVVVSEAILRLLERGDSAVDVGANIGAMASAMAFAVGATGRVLCFEPHPELSVELSDNVTRWRETVGWKHVEASDLAVSEHPGRAALAVGADFETNRGTPTLSPGQGSVARRFDVEATTLDAVVGSSTRIGLLKVDVEGHELQVFKGASSLLTSLRVRDIVFEEYHGYPSPVTELLESHGYRVFLMRKGVLGPVLLDPRVARHQLDWETPNYLATRDADRAVERLAPIGWRSLRRRSFPSVP